MILELQSNKSRKIPRNANEKGMVLIGTLAILAIIFLLAGMAVTSTFTEIRISSNYKTSKQAFYIAEAGVQRAIAELKTVKFNDVLDGTYGGSPGILSFGTDTTFANGTYNVTVQDNNQDITEDSNPEKDIDDIVYIKGTGFLPNGSKSSVKLKIKKTLIPFPPIPAAITIIGEANTSISDTDGMDINVDGHDWRLGDIDNPTGLDSAKYAIALSNIGAGGSGQTPAQAIANLDNDILPVQTPNFVGKPAAYPESIGLDNGMLSQYLQDFVEMAKQVADNSLKVADVTGAIGGSTSGPDNQITIGTQTIYLGSIENPKITYFNMKPEDNGGVDRQVVFSGNITNGSGILIIEGTDLVFTKHMSWTGIVIVIGNDVGGALLESGIEKQTITGAFIVDEQDTDVDKELVLKGDVNVRYSSEAVNMAQSLVLEKGIGDITVRAWGDSRLLP